MTQTVLLQPQSETTVQLTSSVQTTVVLNTVPQCVVELQQDGDPTSVSLSMIPFIPAPPTQLYVQNEQPVIPAATSGLWVQTGLGEDGSGFTFWIEDGQ
jgi:hypothetical protein